MFCCLSTACTLSWDRSHEQSILESQISVANPAGATARASTVNRGLLKVRGADDSGVPDRSGGPQAETSPGTSELTAPGDLASTKILLETSAAAEWLKNSVDEHIRSVYREALNHLAKAQSAYRLNDQKETAAQLSKAKTEFFKAAQMAGGRQTDEKSQNEYIRRGKTVKTLFDAFTRISKEKNVDKASTAERVRRIDGITAFARQKFDHGDYQGANASMNEALALLMHEIRVLRDGSTLIRELHFANKKEEYVYEIDRNNTHRMLITLLLQENSPDPFRAQRVQEAVAEAEQKRTKADHVAASGNFAEGVEWLEASTRQYIAAIRAGGIYIPE